MVSDLDTKTTAQINALCTLIIVWKFWCTTIFQGLRRPRAAEDYKNISNLKSENQKLLLNKDGDGFSVNHFYIHLYIYFFYH